jgi:hypothetical protein
MAAGANENGAKQEEKKVRAPICLPVCLGGYRQFTG